MIFAKFQNFNQKLFLFGSSKKYLGKKSSFDFLK